MPADLPKLFPSDEYQAMLKKHRDEMADLFRSRQTNDEATHDELRSRPLIYDGHLADSIALDAESRAPLDGTIPPIDP